jgi:hypothetical protein
VAADVDQLNFTALAARAAHTGAAAVLLVALLQAPDKTVAQAVKVFLFLPTLWLQLHRR